VSGRYSWVKLEKCALAKYGLCVANVFIFCFASVFQHYFRGVSAAKL
jgi:hypothetical protein